jgi:GT2 family glycosyltransferase
VSEAFSVVVVLHDSAPHLRALLASLEHVRRAGAEPDLVVVDTGSSDEGPALAADAGAVVLPAGRGAGFGAANDLGVARAREDVTALLNPDTELLDAGLLALVARARARDALHVPRLLNADGTVQDSVHPRPGTLREVARAVRPYRAPTPPRRAGWAIAAALVARTATLRRLGPFDPEPHLFYEDLELCLRAAAAGVPLEVHTDVALRHTGGHSTGRLDRLAAEALRRRAVVGGVLGPRARALDDLAQAITFTRAGLGGRDRPRARAQLRALRAARRGSD